MSDIPQLKLALLGQSGAGKTSFFASYYGTQQTEAFEQVHGYRLKAKRAYDSNVLLSRFHEMEQGRFPIATDTVDTHSFDLLVKSMEAPGLEISWLDYPGGWWERRPKDLTEQSERLAALSRLVSSHAIILLLDAARWIDEGQDYLQETLQKFANLIQDIKKDAQDGPSDLQQTVILAVSKADLLDNEATAESVAKKVLIDAQDAVNLIAKNLGSSADKPAPFLSHVMLLSSAATDEQGNADIKQTMSLNLIAPIVCAAILAEAAQRSGGSNWFGNLASLLRKLADLTGILDKLDNILLKKYRSIIKLLRLFPLEEFGKKLDELIRRKEEAVRSADSIRAAAATMALELKGIEITRAYYRVNV